MSRVGDDIVSKGWADFISNIQDKLPADSSLRGQLIVDGSVVRPTSLFRRAYGDQPDNGHAMQAYVGAAMKEIAASEATPKDPTPDPGLFDGRESRRPYRVSTG